MDKFSTESNSVHADGAIKRGVDSAGVSLHDGIEKVADPARAAVERVSTVAHQTVDKLAVGASRAADKWSDQTRWVAEAPSKALETSRSWVQERPMEAVGFAVALGFVLGRLSSR